MFVIIHESNAVKSAQASFEKVVRESATQSHHLHLGYQGGGKMVDVHFIRPLNFWIGLAGSHNRFWNALGIGNPFRDDHSIVAEINPPKDGINRRISGAFVRTPTVERTWPIEEGLAGVERVSARRPLCLGIRARSNG
jgi:hypothetical protein